MAFWHKDWKNLVNPSNLRKMIKTEKLTKVFRTDEVETYALNEVDIHIKEGEFVSIMGPSGCGKSTLLNILGLLDDPTKGNYQLNGTEASSLSGKDKSRFIRENIGFVFQSFILIDELNVYDNIRLPLNYHKMSNRERKEKVNSVLKRMKMGHRKMHYPQQLSGGQQQRIAIARAVVTNPKIIFADEPTGNLDSKNGIEVMNLLSELNREGTTIVMVTHSERDAGFAHRTINLFDGKVVPEAGISSNSGFANTKYQEYVN
jgi:putative ABC transport system ATP-binding protein